MTAVITILVILHAFIDSRLIKAGKHIYHGWEGLIYAAACGVLCFWFSWVKVAAIGILARAAFFDFALNAFRGLPLAYNGQGSSVIDRIENKLKIGVVVRLIALLLIIVLL